MNRPSSRPSVRAPIAALALALVGAPAVAPARAAADDVRHVAVGLERSAAAALERALTERSPDGGAWSVTRVPPDELPRVLDEQSDRRVVAAVGYDVSTLAELSDGGWFVPAPACAAAEPTLAWGDDVHVLWFDPMLIAWSDGGYGVSTRPSWVPDELSALCEGSVDDRLILAGARIWNSTGALVTSLAEAGGGVDGADRRLVGLDGNRAGAYAVDAAGALRRLANAEPGDVAVASRAELRRFARLEPDLAPRLRAVAPRDRVAATVLGAAALEADGAAPVFAALEDPEVLVELARESGLVPIVADADDPAWADAAAARVAFRGELPRFRRERELVRGVVDRFVRDLVGRHEGREALYHEIFDAVGIAAMAIFVVVLLRRRDDRKPAASPLAGGP